jgi:hypothetical protein
MARNTAEALAGRAVTGPFAFFAAGVIELTLYLMAAARRRMRRAPGQG